MVVCSDNKSPSQKKVKNSNWFLGDKIWLMNAIKWPLCINTTPIPSLDASVSMTNCSSKFGKVSTGVVIKASFSCAKAFSASIVHLNNPSLSSQWPCKCAIISNNVPVIATESKTSQSCFWLLGFGPILHCFKFLWISCYAIFSDNVSMVLHLSYAESAFSSFSK